MRRAGLGLAALGLGLGLALPAEARSRKRPRKAAAKPHGHDTAEHDGAALYGQYCALCHAEDRSGYAADEAPSLRSPELMGGASGGYLWTAIAYGRPGTPMAGFADTQGGPLSHAEQHALMDWLVEASGVERAPVEDTPVVGDAGRGARVYADHCAGCHGDAGQGGTGTALGNRVFLATASDAFLRQTIAEGRTGTPMAGFAGTLPDADIDAVTAFLRSRAGGWTATAPVLAPPPDPSAAVLNPDAPQATLDEREGRFVSADSVAAAMARGERLVLLDARPMSDWQRSHLPGALPVPFYDGIDAIAAHLPKDGTPIVAYCACPHAASGRIVDALKAAGFSSARILDEGVLVWAAQGHPLALGTAE